MKFSMDGRGYRGGAAGGVAAGGGDERHMYKVIMFYSKVVMPIIGN